jgi:hypothetical protein
MKRFPEEPLILVQVKEFRFRWKISFQPKNKDKIFALITMKKKNDKRTFNLTRCIPEGYYLLLMVIVNNPGSWGHIYAPLEIRRMATALLLQI